MKGYIPQGRYHDSMHPSLVKFLAVLVILSQGWLGAVRGHSVCIELRHCDHPHHAGHASCDSHEHAACSHAHDETQHGHLCGHVLDRHDHGDMGCHLHVCLPELEQRTQAPTDARAFARLMPAEALAVACALCPPAGVACAVAIERSDGPPKPERDALASTVILV